MDDELIKLRRRIDDLEKQVELSQVKTAHLLHMTTTLFYPVIGMSLYLDSGKVTDAHKAFMEFSERAKALDEKIQAFLGLEEFEGSDE